MGASAGHGTKRSTNPLVANMSNPENVSSSKLSFFRDDACLEHLSYSPIALIISALFTSSSAISAKHLELEV